MIPQFDVTPVFEKNYDSPRRIKVNRGGTRSSKTYSICQLLVFWLFTGSIGRDRWIMKGLASVVRKTFPALKATAYRDIVEILHENNLYQFVQENKTDHIITYKDRAIEFFSADEQQKIRGRKRQILYCNEANELDYKSEFYQLLWRTTDDIFIDFNPDDEYVWINTELEQKRQFDKNDVEVIVSTYLDNTFLPATTISEIEYLRENDPQFWKMFGLGQYGNITGLIFEINIVAAMPEDYKQVGYGMDFGFTNDPTTFYEVGLQNGELWIDELIYETGLTNPAIAQRWRDFDISRKSDIIADSAEPKSIAELSQMGWNVKPATKGADSIEHGIEVLKRYKLNVTARSVNLIKEQKRYKWAVDKNGNSLRKPVDFANHGWDAVRYVVQTKLAIQPTKKVKARTLKLR